MSDKKEIPPDVMVNLVWLEAKRVCRGESTDLFPDMTFLKARIIRSMGFEKFKDLYLKGIQNVK